MVVTNPRQIQFKGFFNEVIFISNIFLREEIVCPDPVIPVLAAVWK
ncbi:hypothetical protein MmTuc01_2275 [Methanosarcina mazei Tuc01]|uniref:Uncharacterized protein n=1 Tax=Methanosarcina mazei Tuc01 TaxID=1236903 RepID=M1QBJ5_METMZ|nr:hypothetical protein MmTuc01_2275 [Methanosarcina mazei Tuc01]